MHRIRRLVIVVASVLTLGAVLSACALVPGGSFDTLCADPLVISCDRSAQSTLVVIDADASEEDVIAFAESLDGATAPFAGTMSLEARSSHALVLDPEVAPPFSWRIDLNAEQSSDLAASLRDTLQAASVPGAVGISRESGWGLVTVQRIEQFEDVFDTLSQGAFADGATYTLQSSNERLRIVHVPERTSSDAIHEIISIARDYPDAEVLLESMTSGPQSPTFSVSRLTPPQQQELAARLRDSRLAGADVDGYPLEFVLGSTGEQGVTYVSGTFGDVPAD